MLKVLLSWAGTTCYWRFLAIQHRNRGGHCTDEQASHISGGNRLDLTGIVVVNLFEMKKWQRCRREVKEFFVKVPEFSQGWEMSPKGSTCLHLNGRWWRDKLTNRSSKDGGVDKVLGS